MRSRCRGGDRGGQRVYLYSEVGRCHGGNNLFIVIRLWVYVGVSGG